jgi:hypothetical protein
VTATGRQGTVRAVHLGVVSGKSGYGADRKGRGVKDGIMLLLCGSSGVERAHNLSGGDSWRRGSRGAFDELVGGGCYQGSGAPWYRRVRECAV